MKTKKYYFIAIILSIAFLQCSDEMLNETGIDLQIPKNTVASSDQMISSNRGNERYIVLLNTEAMLYGQSLAVHGKAKGLLKKYGIDENNIDHVYSYVFQGFSAAFSYGQMKKLEKDGFVRHISHDYEISLGPDITMHPKPDRPGKPGGGNDGGGTQPAQVVPWGITRVGGALDGTAKTAWIVDSGIDFDHPDINVNVSKSKTFITRGKDSKTAKDGHGHGTHVAGTVAALDNDIGVIGVAPGATVVAMKVLDSKGIGYVSYIIAALDHVAANGQPGDAVNMSLGPTQRSVYLPLEEAVKAVADMDINVAIAAGNSGDDCIYYSPARLNYPNVYTVSAMDSNDSFVVNWPGYNYGSNYGSPIDYAAPGLYVLSTYKDSGYATMGGTSMAAPHVCGLLLSGSISSDGFVSNDLDENPDPIAHR